MMIPFLNLKNINCQYSAERIEVCTRIIDSGWYIDGNEVVQSTVTVNPAVIEGFYSE